MSILPHSRTGARKAVGFSRFLRSGPATEMGVSVGALELPSPVMAASGTYGSGAEYASLADPSILGAVVVKSLSAESWAGHRGPNLCHSGLSMLNAVGLANPGVDVWAKEGLQDLLRAGARVVASMWGRSVDEFAQTASALAAIAGPIAWELNLSCPNLHGSRRLIAHDPDATNEVVSAVRSFLPRGVGLWAKLSPNAVEPIAVARAAQAAGATAVTLINTMPGMVIDVGSRTPKLGNTYGGVSGPLLLPIAVRIVHQVHAAIPDLPIVGCGGVSTGEDAVQLMMAGANAVQVGTANFADPRASHLISYELERWCESHDAWPRNLTGSVRSAPEPTDF